MDALEFLGTVTWPVWDKRWSKTGGFAITFAEMNKPWFILPRLSAKQVSGCAL
jgi:hypothetical protein